MNTSNSNTPATELAAAPVEAARPADAHPPAPPGADALVDPEQNPCIVPDMEAHGPDVDQITGPDVDQITGPGAGKTRGWPIATPTWQGVEI